MPTTTTKPPRPGKWLGLTEEEFARFSRACKATWQTIGGDILDASTCGPSGSIPRSHVIEVVLDCGYVLTYGESLGRAPYNRIAWAEFYEGRLAPWIHEHYGTPRFNKLMKEVFPYARYGY